MPKKMPISPHLFDCTLQSCVVRKGYSCLLSKAISILIFKHGENASPENFRPITLEPVCLKVMTSLVRNRIYSFLVANGHAESSIQKGFTPEMSGTLEHIATMSSIINQAKKKRRSVTITLLDLKNAFGEVLHD